MQSILRLVQSLVTLAVVGHSKGLCAAEDLYLYWGSGEIVISPNGGVAEVELDDPPAGTSELLEGLVRAWKFEPVVVDGRAVPVKTRFSYLARALESADNREVEFSIWEASFHGSADEKCVRNCMLRARGPAYPERELRAGIEAHIEVEVEVDQTGSVQRTGVIGGWLSPVTSKNRSAKEMMADFARSARIAAKRWKFDASPNPELRYFFMPVRFIITDVAPRFSHATWVSLPPEQWQVELGERETRQLAEDGSSERPDLQLATPLGKDQGG